jgi:uncharacterized protein (TIGR02271 family)
MNVMQTQEFRDWSGRTLYGPGDEKIGKITDIYLDQESAEPEWLAVSTGLLGFHVSFVPLAQAQRRGEDVVVPFGKDMVKDAPHAEPDGFLSLVEETQLFRHYGVDPVAPAPLRTGTGADDAMTRSEEEMGVAKGTHESGRVRLRKWVETERVTMTVPVSHEEVRVEREPITEVNVDRALSGPAISEGAHEVILHAEQVMATKKAVPVERVRLVTETVTEDREVSADVRKERIEVERNPKGSR